MEHFFRKLNIPKDRNPDLSNIRLPKVSISTRQKSSTILKDQYTARLRFNSALKFLDIKLHPHKFRNPFKKTPQISASIIKPEEDTLEDKDIEYLLDAFLFNAPNQFLLSNSEYHKPLDLLKAEIELNKLKLRKKFFIGEVDEEVQSHSPLETFWKRIVSNKQTVRWDVFEEAIVSQFLWKIDINKGLVRKINWNWLLKNLFKKLSNKSTEVLMVPGHPAMEEKGYKGFVVNFKNFENFVNRGKLVRMFERAVGFDTYYLVERFRKEMYVYCCGTEYKGGFKDFKRDGDGKLTFAEGSQYEGMLFNGTRHGYGKLLTSSCQYEGYWENDCFSGLGTLKCDNGSVVEGVWSKGVLRSGKLTFSGGEYSGYMNQSGFNGQGTFTSKSGEIKKGIWVKGKLEGFGEQHLLDGTQLIGTFKNDFLEGEGIIVCAQYIYIGNTSKSKPLGNGIIKFTDGREYTGEFQNGTMNGKGTLTTSEYRLIGEFVEGKLSGKGEKFFKDLYEYSGEFYDSMMHGHGSLSFKFPEFEGRFKGFFKLNHFKGYGELVIGEEIFVVTTWNSEKMVGNTEIKGKGFVFRGRFVAGVQFYLASVWFDDGGSYSGEWEMEKPHGKGEVKDAGGNYLSCLFQNGVPLAKHSVDLLVFENLNKFYEGFKKLEERLLVIRKNIFVY